MKKSNFGGRHAILQRVGKCLTWSPLAVVVPPTKTE